MALLLELGRREPRMALAGRPLADQAAMVEGLLAGGWTPDALTAVLSAPLPDRITRSVGAILAARLSAVPSVPGPRPTTVGLDSGTRHHECPGRDGLCGRPVREARNLCVSCRE
ncbi:hypothetical protein ACFXDE_12650 [Kitasatospora sp. NPDC059408]|uniref:hypothetical protein n=1 Tax=Kitasatospora sp. NPDC059408 TaxID=3346823 RepID=UPI0036BFEE06